MQVSSFWRWVMGTTIGLFIVVVPFIHYRQEYWKGKRLRTVVPGQVYRSGQMTADGLRATITKYGIRTVLNLQDEAPDPEVDQHYFGGGTVTESELVKNLGARFVFMPVDLVGRDGLPEERPAAIDRFLRLMDDPQTYPVLIHCRAGLHRTGVLVAVYRMEYAGWPWERALRELKANGFGECASTSANDYIVQYILTYQRGIRGDPLDTAGSRPSSWTHSTAGASTPMPKSSQDGR